VSRLPPIAAAVLFLLLGAAAPWANPWLEYQRAALSGLELWRLATAHAAHLDASHGALNGAALLLIWHLGDPVTRKAEWAWLVAGSIAAVDAGLYWLSPAVEWYVGASGLLHGLFAGVALLSLLRGRRTFGLLCLVALAGKLAWEGLAGQATSAALLGDLPMVPAAHLYGSIGGIAAALALAAIAQSRSHRT